MPPAQEGLQKRLSGIPQGQVVSARETRRTRANDSDLLGPLDLRLFCAGQIEPDISQKSLHGMDTDRLVKFPTITVGLAGMVADPT